MLEPLSSCVNPPGRAFVRRIRAAVGYNGGVSPQWRALLLAVAWLNATLVPLIGVPVLLPAIGEEFGRSPAAASWVALAYSLAMAGAFMPASHAGDLLGHKRVALFGSYMEVAFMLALLAAPNLEVLVALRFGQGIVHSLAVPNFNAFAIGGFPQEQRGRAAGVLGGAVGGGMLAVPFLVGLITDTLGWRWVFFIASLVVLVITLWGSFTFKEAAARRREPPTLRQFDLPGAALLMAAVAPLIIGVQIARSSSGPLAWALIALSAALLTAFVAYEARLEHPALPVRMFRRIAFAAPSAYNVGAQFAHGVTIYLLPVFFIQGLGWSATYAGTVMISLAVGRPLAAPIGGVLSDRIGPAPIAYMSALVMTGALTGLAFGAGGSLSGLMLFMALFGVGHGLLGSAMQKQMYAAAPRDALGMAPGVLGLGRHLGQAIGVGIAAAIFSSMIDGAEAAGAGHGFRAALLTTAGVVAVTFTLTLLAELRARFLGRAAITANERGA